jgi:hypothetical protein
MENKENTIEAPITCIPPKVLKRNEFGLICEGVNYVYNENGFVNWRKMIKPEFLVVKKDNFEKRSKPVPTSIEGLEDKDLLILLAGIKDLARIRGYVDVRYRIISPSPALVCAECAITWVPNYETNDKEVTFAGCGDAHAGNTNQLTRNYLTPMAENRAFVRAVRNFLNVPILGQDEVGPSSEGAEDVATSTLREVMNTHGVTFEIIKSKMIEEKVEGAESINSIDEIPRFKKFELIERIKKKAAARQQS